MNYDFTMILIEKEPSVKTQRHSHLFFLLSSLTASEHTLDRPTPHTQATAQARIFGGRGGPLLPAPALSRVSQFALAVSAAQFDTALRNQHALGTHSVSEKY